MTFSPLLLDFILNGTGYDLRVRPNTTSGGPLEVMSQMEWHFVFMSDPLGVDDSTIQFHVISGLSFNGIVISAELQRLFTGANECLSILPWSH